MRQVARAQLPVRLSVVLAILCAVFLLIGGAADAEGPPVTTTEYVVTAGDSLWTIAEVHADPGADVRVLITAIKEASGLESSVIHPGRVLHIPRD